MNLSDYTKRHLLSETQCAILDRLVMELQGGNAKISIRELAGLCFVSTATVMKLVKKLGYPGYSSMVYSLHNRLVEASTPPLSMDLSSILERDQREDITRLAMDLYECRNKKIFVVGLGFSDLAANYIIKRMALFNFVVYDGSPLDVIVGNNEPSVVLYLSKSGETEDIISIARRSKNYGHKTYLVTTNAGSALAQLTDMQFILKTYGGSLYDLPDFYVAQTMIWFEYVLMEYARLLESEEN